MALKIFSILMLCLTLAGCYEAGPEDDATRTVPITNNPNAMPGPMKTSPLPSIF